MPHSSKSNKHHSKTSFRTFVGFHASSLGSQRKATWSRPPAKTAGSSALLSQPHLCDRVMSQPIEFTHEGWMITNVPLWKFMDACVSWLYHTYKMSFLLSTSRLWDLYDSVCVQNDAGELYTHRTNRISFFGWQDLRSWSPNMLTAGLTRCFATDLPHSATSTSRF